MTRSFHYKRVHVTVLQSQQKIRDTQIKKSFFFILFIFFVTLYKMLQRTRSSSRLSSTNDTNDQLQKSPTRTGKLFTFNL